MHIVSNSNPHSWIWGLLTIVPSFIYLAACILIVIKSKPIAARLIRDDGEFNIGFSLSKEDVLTICFCCIGLVVLVSSIPQLTQAITMFSFIERSAGYYQPESWVRAVSNLVAHIVQAGTGLYLFLQARGMTALWYKLRSPEQVLNDTESN